MKVLGGMEELEAKFKNLPEPVTVTTNMIIVKLVHRYRHHSLFMVMGLRPHTVNKTSVYIV